MSQEWSKYLVPKSNTEVTKVPLTAQLVCFSLSLLSGQTTDYDNHEGVLPKILKYKIKHISVLLMKTIVTIDKQLY